MITNFQFRPRRCKFHSLPEEFICMNKQCQYRALLCSDCIREDHVTHLNEIKSMPEFYQLFRDTVSVHEQQFQCDRVMINVKDIVRERVAKLDQVMNEMIIRVVKLMETQRQAIKAKLMQVEIKFTQMQAQYKQNLDVRHDYLRYLAAYKNSPKALQARILCSSQWGIVAIRNAINDLKNLSSFQARDVNFATDQVMLQADKVLKEDNFLYTLRNFLNGFVPPSMPMESPLDTGRNQRINSFIEKSFVAPTNNTAVLTPQSSRIFPSQRPRTYSLSNINGQRPASYKAIESPRQGSLQKIAVKIPSQTKIGGVHRCLKGLKRINFDSVTGANFR